MTMTHQILRNSALSIPVGVLAGAMAGWEDAGAALVSSLVCVGNLWVLSLLSASTLRTLARDEAEPAESAMWMGAIAAKFVLLLLLYAAMMQFLSPFGLAMGFIPLFVGVLATGIQHALLEAGRTQGWEE
jgi:hypothetical protein